MAIPGVDLARSVSRQSTTIVVGALSTPSGPVLVGVPDEVERSYRRQFSVPLASLAADLGATGEPGTVTLLPTCQQRVVVTGLGGDINPEQLRRSVGAATRAILALPGGADLLVSLSLDAEEPGLIGAIVEGALLGAYRIPRSGRPEPSPAVRFEVVTTAKRAAPAVARACEVAAAVWQTRDWINAPANLLYPETFADEAFALARQHRIDVVVLDEKALVSQGFGGILAVGGGSVRPPRLVRLDYHPRGAEQHLVLVGKGITFDSGGLNLKTAEGMYTMKQDMSGAASVLAATVAIARLGLKVRVTTYAAMAENMPSGSAYRPSDVITMYGGRTVENANSDAEGRLVMADALARGSQDAPDLIVDVATLTGACVVALGERIAGLMASDDGTADLVLDAAEVAGEWYWHLPIPDYMDKDLESKVADVKSSASRHGGALYAASFLRTFVADGPRWAHLDIAGPAWNSKDPYDYVPAGATGHSVRTLIALAGLLAD